MILKARENKLYLSIILIIFLGACAYLNSLNGKFVWDDKVFVVGNNRIKGWSQLLDIFTKNTASDSSAKTDVYRPIQEFTYVLDHSLWRLNVFGYHITCTLLHILVALGIYWLISILYRDNLFSLLTSLLFVVYPGHTQAVVYISARSELLSALFMLLCFIFYLKYLESKSINSYIFTLLGYVFALLSKENALILPALLLLYHYAFRKKIRLNLFLPILSIVFIYALLRMATLGALYQGTDILLKRIPGFLVAITNYLRIILFPFNLHMEYGNRLYRIVEPKALFGLLAASSLLIYAFKKKNKSNLIFFSVYWYFIALLPTSGIYPATSFYMSEQWLYFPSLGFFLILGQGLVVLYKSRGTKVIAAGLIIGLIFFYLFLTIHQNIYWKEPIAFYKRTLWYSPNSARVHYNLGIEYLEIGDNDMAIAEFRSAIGIDPKMALAYYNLGLVYSKIGDNDMAIAEFRRAIINNPNYADAYNNIGKIYIAIGKNEEAINFCKKAITQAPTMATAYFNLGNAYYNLGAKEEAMQATQRAIELDPNFVEAYNNLASVYSEMGKIDEAIALWNKAVQLSPGFAVAHFNLAVFYFQKKQYALAIRHCDRVIALGNKVDPEFLKLLQPHRTK